jgi:hypothetical protein
MVRVIKVSEFGAILTLLPMVIAELCVVLAFIESRKGGDKKNES